MKRFIIFDLIPAIIGTIAVVAWLPKNQPLAVVFLALWILMFIKLVSVKN